MNELEKKIDAEITRVAEKYGLDYSGDIGEAERARVRYVAYEKMKNDEFSMFDAVLWAVENF